MISSRARTTEAVRRAIQLQQGSIRALAKRFGVSPTTVQKWRRRSTTSDVPMDPKEVCSSVPKADEEASIVAFRITVRRVQAKSKLSQNREGRDHLGAIEGLRASGKAALAARMARRGAPDPRP